MSVDGSRAERAGAPRVALLAGPGQPTWVVHHALRDRFNLVATIIESPPARLDLIRRRAKRLGVPTVLNQLAFQGLLAPILAARSRRRRAQLLADAGLDAAPIPESDIQRVPSVNSPAAAEALRRARPDVVVVQGTRIISAEQIRLIGVPMLNTHAGWTPRYRGVHGAYWALAEQDIEHCGVTVHRVDAGIDTGAAVARARVHITPHDDYSTYPVLQLIEGVRLLVEAVGEQAYDAARAHPLPMDTARSKLWSHPTLTGFLYRRWFLGVR